MWRRLYPLESLCRWGPKSIVAHAVFLIGIGIFVGCSSHRADVLDDVLRQQILLPSGSDLRGPAVGEALGGAKSESPGKGELARSTDGLPEVLTLPRAIERVAQENPHVQFMKARVEQARDGADIAFAEFLPTASAKYRYVNGGPGTFTFPTQPPSGSVGVVSFASPSTEHQQTELYLQWLVYDFGRRKGRHHQATLAAEIADLQYQRAIETAQFNVTAAYFDVLRTLALRRIAEEAIRRAESNLRDARNLLAKGVAVRNDVLRAEVLLGDDRLQMVAAERAVGVARATLNEAIGSNVSGTAPVADVRQDPVFGLALADALQMAADNRREFAAALRSIRSAHAGRGVATADFMPRINVSGAANFLGPQDKERTLLDAGVNIEISLFEGGRRSARVHQADAEIRGAVAQGQEICNRIALEVNIAWLEVKEARERVALARTTLTQAAENMRVVSDLFRKGNALPTEVADADLIFVRAEQNDATALYAYQTVLARLAYALGIPLDRVADMCVAPGCSQAGDAGASGLTSNAVPTQTTALGDTANVGASSGLSAVPFVAAFGRPTVGTSSANTAPAAVSPAR
jgi:outer membrane protein TolC